MIIYKRLDAYNKTGMIEVRQSDGVDVSAGAGTSCCETRKCIFRDSVIDHLQFIAPVAAKVLELDKYRAKDMHKDGYVQGSSGAGYETDFVTLRVDLPIAIARQMQKHQVGFVFSEASGRYICYSKVHKPSAYIALQIIRNKDRERSMHSKALLRRAL